MKNYKLAISNEQLTMSNVSNRSGLPKRGARKQRHCSLLPAHRSLILALPFLLFSLFILLSSCDLFTGPKVDLFQQIKGEIDWDNAPKLTVRIDYPSAWGISSPIRGDITPTTDLRKGYEFSVTFTPGSAYALRSWQVYYTADLDRVSGQPEQPGNWLDDPKFIAEEDIEPITDSDEITLPTVDPVNDAWGGTFKFTIYTTEPVTLVPWCDPQLRIIKTTPYDRPDPPISRATAIVIYFNGAIDEKAVKFAEDEDADGIWIESVQNSATLTNKDYGWYNDPEYVTSNGLFMIIITPKIMSPENSTMTVKLNGITDIHDNPMTGRDSFSWKTMVSSSNVHIDSWSAVYECDEESESGNINVNCVQTGADSIETYYRLNKGLNIQFYQGRIGNVPAPNDSGISEGRQISGIREYEIIIELYKGDELVNFVSFKIWNIPGMEVSNTNSAIEVSTEAQLIAMNNNLGGQYVLANDINIIGDWMPIGEFDNDHPELSFTGKFYGNGHTVTLNGGFNGELLCYGLFGCAQNAVIRDFTLEYKNPSPITPSYGSFSVEINGEMMTGEAIVMGGVAGLLINTDVRNIITSGGTLAVYAPASHSLVDMVSLGGIAGMIEGEGRIENCRAALSVACTSKGQTGGDIGIGAIAGMASKALLTTPAHNGSGLILNWVTIAADVSADKGSYGGRIVIGGAFGGSTETTLNDIKFIAGKTVSFTRKSNDINYCGGITGNSCQINIDECEFSGNIIGTIETTGGGNGYTRIGGIAAQNDDKDDEDPEHPVLPNPSGESYYIRDCRIQGNIKFTGEGGEELSVGGIIGYESNYRKSEMIISNCHFDKGTITVEGSASKIYVGGSFALLNKPPNGGEHSLYDCGSLGGTITINAAGALFVGGFVSDFSGDITNVFSRINIDVKENKNSGACNVGGLLGRLYGGSINECYAAGTVSVVTESKEISNSGAAYGYTSVSPSVGGLVGRLEGAINNSYALGNVVLSDSGTFGPASAGGLVGSIVGGSISNCFSVGKVSAQSASTVACSGGIIGFNNGGTINNTAALGASVTARGGTKSTGRIYGDPISNIGVNNYALKTMLIEEDAYNSINPATRSPVPGATTRDGQDAASSTFLSSAFWNTTLGFSESVDVDNAKVFIWNFNRVGIDGYPRLAWEK